MTSLKCSASTCVYNDNHLCSRGSIDVMGENATCPDETCCGSFEERLSYVGNSSADPCGCSSIQINCKAGNCTYNEHHRCSANSIGVDGPHAQDAHQTKCDTFACRC